MQMCVMETKVSNVVFINVQCTLIFSIVFYFTLQSNAGCKSQNISIVGSCDSQFEKKKKDLVVIVYIFDECSGWIKKLSQKFVFISCMKQMLLQEYSVWHMIGAQ